MTARQLLFNRVLGLAHKPEVLQTYYMAEWSMSFFGPIIGLLTDLAGPRWRRRFIVTCLVANVFLNACFAIGLVNTTGLLYAFGLPAAATHDFALAAINGALIADGTTHGGGDSKVARGRQAAKLTCMTLGDLIACAASTALEGVQLSQGWLFALTAIIVAVAALVACTLPLPLACHDATEGSAGDRSSTTSATSDASTSVQGETPTLSAAAAQQPLACGAEAPEGAAPPHARHAPPCRWWCMWSAPAVLGALAAATFTLPPTSFVFVSSYLYSRPGEAPLPTWLLSAMQLAAMAGSLLGTLLMWRLDLPLRASLVAGATLFALGSASQLSLFAIKPTGADGLGAGRAAALLLQPLVQAVLVRGGLIPIYNLAAASAATVGSEGGGFALVMAAEAAGGETAALIATTSVKVLRIGAPPGRSWAQLPLFVGLCAVAKLLAVPVALLLLAARDLAGSRSARRAAQTAGSASTRLLQ